MDYYEIGQKVRKIRKARGMSQEALAERIGISTTHMSHIETGNTKLSLPVFIALASALEVSADELLSREVAETRSGVLSRIAAILDSCSTPQAKAIEDIVRAAAEAMNKYM